MSPSPLGPYLNNHLAGPPFALGAARHCRDHTSDARLVTLLSSFIEALGGERELLLQVMKRLEVSPNVAKSAVSWVTEKVARLALLRAPGRYTDFSALQQLELLRLGVQGKLGLWRLLEQVAEHDTRLRGFDFSSLARRAEGQIAALEGHRLRAGLSLAGQGSESSAGSSLRNGEVTPAR